MAQQDPNDPQYYPKSRSAMRSMYGSRKIDARPRQSPADTTPSGIDARRTGNQDTTPSGRARFRAERGIDPEVNQQFENLDWRAEFGSPLPPSSPMARMAPPPAAPPLDIFGEIRNAHAQGFQSANWQIPGGGSVGFSLAPTTPPDQNAVASQLSSIPMPKSLFSGFGQQKRPSVLSSASKWLAPV